MARYLVTGGAGFIGSNLVDALVARGDDVRVLDDLSTGHRSNLADAQDKIQLFEGSICNREILREAMANVDYCLHQAAIPSVPRSTRDPWASNHVNIDGTLNVFLEARDAGVGRVVFASSSSVYGDATTYPVHEGLPVAPLSNYGVTKATAEMYAQTFSSLYEMDIVALRYFNVFGPRQDPESEYAAVIPKFITRMLAGQPPVVEGDGLQSRDFTFVDNVVAANLLACDADEPVAGVYNVSCGISVTILGLAEALGTLIEGVSGPEFAPARLGDIRKSYAAIEKAREAFDFEPKVGLEEGLRQTVAWFEQLAR